jgi:hypothetical protein
VEVDEAATADFILTPEDSKIGDIIHTNRTGFSACCQHSNDSCGRTESTAIFSNQAEPLNHLAHYFITSPDMRFLLLGCSVGLRNGEANPSFGLCFVMPDFGSVN